MNLWLRLLGAALLVLTGCGCGAAAYGRRRDAWRQLHTFAKLLWHLQTSLEYKALPAHRLLRTAALYPEFATLGLENCQSFAELPLPPAMSRAVKREIAAELAGLGMAPRHTVCTALRRLYEQSEKDAIQAEQQAAAALQLYPRLGACAGLLAAILFL